MFHFGVVTDKRLGPAIARRMTASLLDDEDDDYLKNRTTYLLCQAA